MTNHPQSKPPSKISLAEFTRPHDKNNHIQPAQNRGVEVEWIPFTPFIHIEPPSEFATIATKAAKRPLLAAQSSAQRTAGHSDLPQDNIYDCPGCGGSFPADKMTLDHQVPRADYGREDNTNQILLCDPCNKTKCDLFTISGLQWYNHHTGHMINWAVADIAHRNALAARDDILGATRAQSPWREKT